MSEKTVKVFGLYRNTSVEFGGTYVISRIVFLRKI